MQPPPPASNAPAAGSFPPPSAFPPPPPPLFSNGFTPPAAGPAQLNWTPPPKPGLIPLRPLGFGTLLGAGFTVMRRNPKPTLGLALGLNGLVSLLLVGIVAGFTAFAVNRVQSAAPEEMQSIVGGIVGGGAIALIVPIVLSLLVGAVVQGIISLEVARATLGDKLSVKGLWRLARGRIGALIGWALGVSLVVILAFVLVMLAFTAIAIAGGAAGIAIAFIIGLIASMGASVLSAWLSTKLALVPIVLMVERLSLIAAVKRSWSLTNGFFWKTFGILILISVIINFAMQLVVTPIVYLVSYGGVLLNPNGEEEAILWSFGIAYLAAAVVAMLFGAAAIVIQSAVVSLIYIDIRMRKEGLDIELTRFVEARQSGDTSVVNPYERLDPSAPGYSPPVASNQASTPS